jgi:DNA mismatch repair protein MutS2
LLDRGITTLVTTHHPELKAFAHATPGVVNASVEFDVDTLQPTYNLTVGLPGRSNALAIARRLGMPEEIISSARKEIDPNELRADDLLNEIHHQRDLSRRARAESEQARQDADRLRAELLQRLDKIEDERRQILEKARLETEQEVESLQAEIREARRVLAKARQPLDILKVVEEVADELEAVVEKPVERIVPNVGMPVRRAIRLGDKVKVRTLNAQGIVTSLGGEEAEVQVGVLRVRARLSELETVGGSMETAKPVEKRKAGGTASLEPQESKKKQVEEIFPASPGMELDLRGRRADEALDELDRYLDAAYLSGLPFVRIIHGKGTGRLREVVRQALHQHSQVKSYEAGAENEGGEGVTIAKMSNV